MLKLPECGIFDAEFSHIKYNYRLNGSIESVLHSTSLRECVQKCTVHPVCQSVNYMRQNLTCEFIGDSLLDCSTSEEFTLIAVDGWNHFETKDKKAVSRISK